MIKSFFSDIRRFMKLLRKNFRPYVTAVLFFGIVTAVANLVITFSMKAIIDFLVYRDQALLFYAIAAVSMRIIIVGGLYPFMLYIVGKRQQIVLKDIRKYIFNHLTYLPSSYFAKTHSGDIIARVNTDIDSLKVALDIMNDFTRLIIALLVAVPYFIYLDYRLLLVALFLGIIFLFVTLRVLNPIRKTFGNIRKNISHMSETITESVIGFQTIRMFGIESVFRKRFNKNLDNIYAEEKRYSRLKGFVDASNIFIWRAGGTSIAVLGAWFVINRTMELGNLVAAVTMAVILVGTLMSLGDLPSRIQHSFAGVERLYELIDAEAEPESYNVEGLNELLAVGLENISYSYDTHSQVIKGLNLKVPHGSTIALVGNSGGGKSTAARIIMGLLKPDSGKITINSRSMKDYSLYQIRELIAYVPQNAYMFNGTIKENILYGNPDATDADVTEAAKKANAHDFIMAKNAGYETQIGERGIKLAGGERQRVAIARAIIRNAPILILDEATSSLDNESEQLVQKAMDNLMHNKSSIVIAHRLSTIKHADCICFIKDGCVAEQGTHDELISTGGLYSELYNREFANENKNV